MYGGKHGKHFALETREIMTTQVQGFLNLMRFAVFFYDKEQEISKKGNDWLCADRAKRSMHPAAPEGGIRETSLKKKKNATSSVAEISQENHLKTLASIQYSILREH